MSGPCPFVSQRVMCMYCVGMKQLRMDGGNVTVDQLVCLSPNGCCVAVGVRECIHFFDSGHLLTNSECSNNHNCGG